MLHAVIASASESVVPFISAAATSKEPWEKIQKMYANRSRSMMMSLKDKLVKPRRYTTISEYFQHLKVISHELALINYPILEDDLVLFALNGIGLEYKALSAGIRVRESPISFEELMDTFIKCEEVLKQDEPTNDAFSPIAHLCFPIWTKQ